MNSRATFEAIQIASRRLVCNTICQELTSAGRSKFGTYRYHSDGEMVEFARRTAGTRLHKETDCPRRALQAFCLASWRSSACAAVGGAAGNEAELSKTYPRATISRKLFRYRPFISSASAEMSEVLPC